MATFYLDPEGGNDANDGTTFANRWKTIISGATAARIAPGDTIRIMASIASTDTGINATWTKNSPTVTLASALNVLVTDCETAWTASANVTATAATDFYRTGTKSCKLVCAAGFTTGKLAYFDLGSNQDYSAYQGITFWLRHDTAIAASNLTLNLCSDTTGDTPVDTFTFEAESQLIGGQIGWYAVYLDKGSALGSAIRSISISATSDPGTLTMWIDNISTVKQKGTSDNLNLQSLISKTGGDEGWWAIRGISGTTVTLDSWPTIGGATASRGYWGTTESVALHKQEPTRPPMTAAQALALQDAGTAGNLITYSGGWNRTDMSTQTGRTWLDGRSGTNDGFYAFTTGSYSKFERIDMCRWYRAFYGLSGGGIGSVYAGDFYAAACQNAVIGWDRVAGWDFAALDTPGKIVITGSYQGVSFNGAKNASIGNVFGYGLHSSPVYGGSSSFDGYRVSFGNIFGGNCGDAVIYVTTSFYGFQTGNITARDCVTGVWFANNGFGWLPGWIIGDIDVDGTLTGGGVIFAGYTQPAARIKSVTSTNHASGTIPAIQGLPSRHSIIGPVTTSGSASGIAWRRNAWTTGRVRTGATSLAEATKFDNVAGFVETPGADPWSFKDYLAAGDTRVDLGPGFGTIVKETTTRHTASGLAWKVSVTDATEINQYCPIRVPIAKIFCGSTGLVQVTLFVYRSNTGLNTRLIVRGRQIPGVDNDQTADAASSGTWEQLTLSFTPTSYGLVPVELLCWGGTTYNVIYDDLRIAQGA